MTELSRPSPTIHEAHVERHRVPDSMGDDIMGAISEATQNLRLAAESARDTTAKILGNQLLTEAARHVSARQTNAKILESATRRVDAAHKKVAGTLAALESNLAGPPAPKEAAAIALAAEVRQAFSRMDDKARKEATAAALEQGDDATVAALLAGPVYLTGLGNVQRDALRLGWQQRHRAEEIAARDRLLKARHAMDAAAGIAMKYISDLTDGAHRRARTGEREVGSGRHQSGDGDNLIGMGRAHVAPVVAPGGVARRARLLD